MPPSAKPTPLPILILFAWFAAASPARAGEPGRVEAWKGDLRFVLESLEKHHPAPFGRIDRDAFVARLEALGGDLPALADHEVVVRLAEIVALLGDGHTRLSLPFGPGIEFEEGHSVTPPPAIETLRFHQFPVRFALLDDDLFILRIDDRHRAHLGARVARLGRLAARDAIEAVAPAIRRDNEMQVRDLLPQHLALAEVLHGRGVIEDSGLLPLTLEGPGGSTAAIVLPRVEFGSGIRWAGLRDGSGTGGPLSWRDNDRPYWFEDLPERGVVYFQFNQVGSREGESLDAFSRRLMEAVERPGDRALIIDLRRNRGGWYETSIPLLRALTRSDAANRFGRLFVLIGRGTFSAAMMFALDLEQQTEVLFVGEPTGASPNHFGDATKVRLPYSGLTLRVSTLYWQYSDPRDRRRWLEPHFKAPPSIDDLRGGRDSALDLAMRLGGPPAKEGAGAKEGPAAGRWAGALAPHYEDPIAFELEIEEGEEARRAIVAVPAIGLEPGAAERAEFGPGRLRLERRLGEGDARTLILDGELRAGWILGKATILTDLGPVEFPFTARRRDDP
jgi:hypothetical protein